MIDPDLVRAADRGDRHAFDAVTRECEQTLAQNREALARRPDDRQAACEVANWLSIIGARKLHVGEV
jgi:hypothetical protein